MRLFKIILILVLLIGISFGVCGNYRQLLTQGEIDDWQTIGKVETIWIMTEEARTLVEWFEDLTLEGKLEIYNWWKSDGVDWKKDCIEMPPKIKDWSDSFMIPAPIPNYPEEFILNDLEDYTEDIGEEPGFWFAKPGGEDDE